MNNEKKWPIGYRIFAILGASIFLWALGIFTTYSLIN